jgi:hypothetical protein
MTASSPLPRIICSSVVRSVHQGESHGGVYLVDMAEGTSEQLLDWTDANIDWEGRGGDRGLRGIAFHDGLIFLAASDEIFVYDRQMRRQGSFRNPYLHLCHEIFVAGDRLYLASTGFDSVLEYDLAGGTFTQAWCVRYARAWRFRRRLHLPVRPSLRRFDPNAPGGPPPGDSSHVNHVWVRDGALFASGTKMPALWRIDGNRLERFARVPFGTHNARPFRDGALFNHTRTDRIAYADRSGTVVASVPLPDYPKEQLLHADLPEDLARPTFGRGLTVLADGTIVGGSSPATISAYDLDAGAVVASVNLTMDVRNAVHGLEVWPFDGSSSSSS